MKKTIFFVLGLIILLSACAEEVANYLTYDGDQFSIEYPSDWKQTEFQGLPAFVSPKEDASDVFYENLNAFVSTNDEGLTLDDYVSAGIENLKQVIPGFELEKVENIELSGLPARKFTYSASKDGVQIKFVQVLALKDNMSYTITFTAEAEKLGRYSGIVNHMIDSFTVKG